MLWRLLLALATTQPSTDIVNWRVNITLGNRSAPPQMRIGRYPSGFV